MRITPRSVNPGRVTSPLVSTYSVEGAFSDAWIMAVPASGTFGSANKGYYAEIIIPSPCTVTKVWWANGATVSSDTFYVGLFDDDGAGRPKSRLFFGSATTSGSINTLQFVALGSPYQLAPGRYWLWVSASGVASTIFKNGATVNGSSRFLESTGVASPPATATPVNVNGDVNCYVAGLQTRATP